MNDIHKMLANKNDNKDNNTKDSNHDNSNNDDIK